MKVLVAGLDRVDAGKTTFSVGLLERMGGVGFKPRAGNDYWFDQADYQRAVSAGRLYGKDARRLAMVSARKVEPERINPIHRLWRPAPGPGTGLIGGDHREFVLDRVGDGFVVNANADVPDSATERLPLGDAPGIESIADLNRLTRERYLPALDRIADEIAENDPALVESYGDVACPVQDVAFDVVVVVEPARASVYDGERYLTAHEVVGGGGGPRTGVLEERVEELISHLDPVATLRLPALTHDERSDPAAVADAYEVAYDAVLAAGVE